MATEAKEPKEQVKALLRQYLSPDKKAASKGGEQKELELRFQSGSNRPLTKLDYDNVVQALFAAGFACHDTQGDMVLRMHPEYVDKRTGERKLSNVRAELYGTDLIATYWSCNSLEKVMALPSSTSASFAKVRFTKKSPVIHQDQVVRMVKWDDWQFRVDMKWEEDVPWASPPGQALAKEWTSVRKRFRHMNRVRFVHPVLPFAADLSMVRTSVTTRSGVPLPQYTMQDAELFRRGMTYEIEMELLNERCTKDDDEHTLMTAIEKVVRIVLSGLQQSLFPIAVSEQRAVQREYEALAQRFLGPHSVALQWEHLLPDHDVNVHQGYCVTEKADGERKLLFVANNRKLYFVDNQFRVQFTGMIVDDKRWIGTVVDGEYVRIDAEGRFLHLFLAFDLYFVEQRDVRGLAFAPYYQQKETDSKFRLLLLQLLLQTWTPRCVTKSGAQLRFRCKRFEMPSAHRTIQRVCTDLLATVHDGLVEYPTDGLVFTPLAKGIDPTLPGRMWKWSLKWKPPETNTNDFLVSRHDDMSDATVCVYVLRCGYNRQRDGYLNPFQDILDARWEQEDIMATTTTTTMATTTMTTTTMTTNSNSGSSSGSSSSSTYLPVPFCPTLPYDPEACYVRVLWQEDVLGNRFTTTEQGDVFDDHMIVELRYDHARAPGWRWVPLRVRHDKTAELWNGGSQFGNAFWTANNNWRSIHNPVTVDMLTQEGHVLDPAWLIQKELEDQQYQYYRDFADTDDKDEDKDEDDDAPSKVKIEEDQTTAMRHFHNRVVKRQLLSRVCRPGHRVLDLAVGRGGDLAKWREARVAFVLGIDLAADNLHDRKQGACARYLDLRQKHKGEMPAVLFLHGNAALSLRGPAFFTDKDNTIAQALFGKGPKDEALLGKTVFGLYGVAKTGFDVCSLQFALHYFWSSFDTLHGLLGNVAERTVIGGYFVGTCFDGDKVHARLASLRQGESWQVTKTTEEGRERVLCRLTKHYADADIDVDVDAMDLDKEGKDDEGKGDEGNEDKHEGKDVEKYLGRAIDVYQESIRGVHREYLVSFDVMDRFMANYGFVPEHGEHVSFDDWFSSSSSSTLMSKEEQQISFLNRTFVYKKTTHVDIERVRRAYK